MPTSPPSNPIRLSSTPKLRYGSRYLPHVRTIPMSSRLGCALTAWTGSARDSEVCPSCITGRAGSDRGSCRRDVRREDPWRLSALPVSGSGHPDSPCPVRSPSSPSSPVLTTQDDHAPSNLDVSVHEPPDTASTAPASSPSLGILSDYPSGTTESLDVDFAPHRHGWPQQGHLRNSPLLAPDYRVSESPHGYSPWQLTEPHGPMLMRYFVTDLSKFVRLYSSRRRYLPFMDTHQSI